MPVDVAVDEGETQGKLGKVGELIKSEISKWASWIDEHKEKIKAFISELGNVVAFFWDLVSQIIALFGAALGTMFGWLLDNPKLFAAALTGLIAAFITYKTVIGLVTTAQALMNAVMLLNPTVLIIAAIIGLIAAFAYLWKTSDAFRNFWIGLWDGIKNTFKAVSDFFTNAMTVDWTESFGIFGNVLNAFFANFSNIFNAVKQIFTGIIDFIAGVFTGDWERAWSGIVNIFGGIFNGLQALVTAPFNAIIGLVNMMIDGVNALNIDIPDWVPGLGGKKLGFEIPKIPALATGGFVKANTPQLAMIGDNRHQGEVVAPENKIAEIVSTAMAQAMAALMPMMNQKQQADTGMITIPIYVNNELTDEYIVNAATREAFRNGGR